MSARSLGQDGVYRRRLDASLKRAIFDRAQRRFKTDTQATKETSTRILAHPYLYEDVWANEEDRVRNERAERCRKLLVGLKTRFARREISVLQAGLEGTTGQAALTIDKLFGHSVRVLDLSPDWLLVSVERHPYGGSGMVLTQYWLYSIHHRSLRLLRERDLIAYPATGAPMLQNRDGTWRAADNSLEEDFFRLVESRLGGPALEEIKRSDAVQDVFCTTPPEILDECKTITGVDYASDEKRRRELFERTLTKKHGPRKHDGPKGYAFVPGALRLILAREQEKRTE